ncbi:MAG: hypothetical protein CMM46_00180 [Rhodospirillaceae bacterium]|nr:hypothetical protein [Rhodospirillaceae bacterium]
MFPPAASMACLHRAQEMRTILRVNDINTLQINDVAGADSGVAPVDGVSLRLSAGQTLVLLGDSRSGKESLVRLVAGFGDLVSGTIAFNGHDITRMPPHKRPFTLLTARDALFPHLDIANNVAYGIKPRIAKKEGGSDPRVLRTLEMVELTAARDAFPEALSPAERQQVALARALAVEPLVLLLDNALNELDPLTEGRVMTRLRDLQRQAGFSILDVRRKGSGMMALADHMGVLAEGQLLELDRPQVLYSTPRSALTASLTGPINLIPGDRLADRPESDEGSITRKAAMGRASWALALRPDAIELHLTDANLQTPSLRGKIDGVAYSAFGLTAHIRLSGLETLLTARVDHKRLDVDDLPPGRRVWCTWDDSAANVVPWNGPTEPDRTGHDQGASR